LHPPDRGAHDAQDRQLRLFAALSSFSTEVFRISTWGEMLVADAKLRFADLG